MSEGPTNARGDQTLQCRKCNEQISVTATTCPLCGATIITTSRAKIMMGLGGLFTLPLVYTAARATLDLEIGGFTGGFFFVLAMFSAFWLFIGYTALVQRRKSLAEEGLTHLE